MVTLEWRDLTPASDPACFTRFVEIMRGMDDRYRAFNAKQLLSWITAPANAGYAGVLHAGLLIPTVNSAASIPDAAQMALLVHEQDAPPKADLLMIGWCPMNCADVRDTCGLDAAIDLGLVQLRKWLRTNQPKLRCVRPKTMRDPRVSVLHERAYQRSKQPAVAGNYIQLLRETPLADSDIYFIRIFP